MRYALSAERMRRAEERAVAESGASLAELMERAGAAVARHAESMAGRGRVVVLAGTGNNGGDGWVAADALRAEGRDVAVIAPGGLPLRSPAADAASRALSRGVAWREGLDGAEGILADASLVVDALFGLGLRGGAREPFASAIRAAGASGRPILAVDVPSGVDSDTGAADGPAIAAVRTLTFSTLKPGLLLHPGASLAGEVVVIGIDVPSALLGGPGDPEVWEDADYAALVPLPEPDTHKNRRGRVLVVAGSGAFPGAAALAAMGAQRAGAGYVTLAAPDSAARVANALLPSVVVSPLPENPSRTLASKAAEAVLGLAAEHDAVVVGPGLTLAHGSVLVARTVVARAEAPLVLDADALNALVDAIGLLGAREGTTVLTPHPGELARLLGVQTADVQRDRLSYGMRLAEGAITCLLKGARTVIAGDGRRVVDTAGTPALAHAGTGDVLAGAVGTLLAQGLPGLEAGALAAHLHGWAGRLAAEEGSELAVTAEDVAAFLPGALRRLVGR